MRAHEGATCRTQLSGDMFTGGNLGRGYESSAGGLSAPAITLTAVIRKDGSVEPCSALDGLSAVVTRGSVLSINI